MHSGSASASSKEILTGSLLDDPISPEDPDELEANRTYLLKADLDLSTQVIRAGKKCLLKPVLKVVSMD